MRALLRDIPLLEVAAGLPVFVICAQGQWDLFASQARVPSASPFYLVVFKILEIQLCFL